MKFKIEVTEEKGVRFLHRDKTFAIAHTSDGVMLKPDWMESNNHLTVMPTNSDTKGSADLNVHLTKETKGEENETLEEEQLWMDELVANAYSHARGRGELRRAEEFADADLLLLDMEAFTDELKQAGFITDSGDMRYGASRLERFLTEDLDSFEAFLNRVSETVSIEEAYDSEEVFCFDSKTGSILWLCPDGYVVESTLDDLTDRDFNGLRPLEMFDKLFEDEEFVE